MTSRDEAKAAVYFLNITGLTEAAEADALGDELLEAGASAVETRPVEGSWAVLVYAARSALAELASIAAEGRPHLRVERQLLDADWDSAWTCDLKPVEINGALRLIPMQPGSTQRASSGRVLLEAGMAFGYGEHPTTTMIARWLATNSHGQRVLDFGAGSGVLALVACRCGAESAVGLELDPNAVRMASRNAVINELTERCRFSSAPVETLSARFDVVVANIDVRTLVASAPALVEAMVTSAKIAVAGFLCDDVDQISQCFAQHGVLLSAEAEVDEWALLTGTKY